MDFNNVPIGFALGMAARTDAYEAYNRLTEAEKEDVINRCRDAKSKAEMDRIISSLK